MLPLWWTRISAKMKAKQSSSSTFSARQIPMAAWSNKHFSYTVFSIHFMIFLCSSLSLALDYRAFSQNHKIKIGYCCLSRKYIE